MQDEFRMVWRRMGVTLTKANASALFRKYGCDQEHRMPYDVFVHTLFGSQTRMLGLADVKRGPFKVGDDYSFRGKITYRFCRKAVHTPTLLADADVARSARVPDVDLALEHVHGYAGIYHTAPNVFYTSQGHVVFPVAAVVVCLDKEGNRQRFFLGHDDDVTCLCMHPGRRLAASGQVASLAAPPCCVVWDTVTLQEVCRLEFPPEAHKSFTMVAAAAFSPCGSRLAVVLGDDQHTVLVFEWERRTCVFRGVARKGDPPQVAGIAWNPFPRGDWTGKATPPAASEPYMFVTFGVKARAVPVCELTEEPMASLRLPRSLHKAPPLAPPPAAPEGLVPVGGLAWPGDVQCSAGDLRRGGGAGHPGRLLPAERSSRGRGCQGRRAPLRRVGAVGGHGIPGACGEGPRAGEADPGPLQRHQDVRRSARARPPQRQHGAGHGGRGRAAPGLEPAGREARGPREGEGRALRW